MKFVLSLDQYHFPRLRPRWPAPSPLPIRERVGEMRVIRKFSLGIALFLVICGIFYYRSHRTKVARETAYAANRQVIVWSTTAQVREPSATLNFGDPVQILDEFEDQAQVRTAAGVTGWVSKDDLLSADFWKKMQDLDAASSKLPVEARGHTHVLSNLRLDPGRESPRIRQLNKDVPVDLIERQVAAVPGPSGSAVQPPAAAPCRKRRRHLTIRHSLRPIARRPYPPT